MSTTFFMNLYSMNLHQLEGTALLITTTIKYAKTQTLDHIR